jgi:hypothetical protein
MAHKLLVALALAAGSTMAMSLPAAAWTAVGPHGGVWHGGGWGWHGGWGWRPGWHGCCWGGVAAGVAVGTAVGVAAASRPVYVPPGSVYVRPPVVYAPGYYYVR